MLDKTSSNPCQAVIVLANLMDIHGIPNPESLARIDYAVNEFFKLGPPHLVTCGWAYRPDSAVTIGDAFKSHILATYDIAADQIIVERNSRDTVGDAYFTKVNLSRRHRWKNICVVTSDYHVARVREIFKFVYGAHVEVNVVGALTPYDESKIQSEIKSMQAFKNSFLGVESGNEQQIYQALRHGHPFYNGAVYSQI